MGPHHSSRPTKPIHSNLYRAPKSSTEDNRTLTVSVPRIYIYMYDIHIYIHIYFVFCLLGAGRMHSARAGRAPRPEIRQPTARGIAGQALKNATWTPKSHKTLAV